MSCNLLPPFFHLNRGLHKGGLSRAISIILILLLAGSSGSPVFARSLGRGLAVLQGQLTRLSRFAPALAISKPRGAAQSVIENHGMPPNPPSSVGLRPEPPQSRWPARPGSPVSY